MEDPVAAGCKAVRAEVAVLPLHPSSPEDRHLRDMPTLELKDLAARYADKVGAPRTAAGKSRIRAAGTAAAGARVRRCAADARCALPGAWIQGDAAGKRSGCYHRIPAGASHRGRLQGSNRKGQQRGWASASGGSGTASAHRE